MKKTTFRQPMARDRAEAAEQWVSEKGQGEEQPPKPALPSEKPARLTIDLPSELHSLFKAACARRRVRMVDEVRLFIEEWTQKNG